MIKIEVFVDIICPWCYIAKRRLASALQMIEGRIATEVRWLPFELNPTMPKQGIERRVYRTNKFGSWERSRALDAQVAEIGQVEGLNLVFDRVARTPNTFDAHRLIALASRSEMQDAVVEALFRAYFVEGRDLCDQTTLLDIVSEAGLDRSLSTSLLGSDEGSSAIRAKEARARLMGVKGVPHFVLNDAYDLSGAWDAGSIVAAMERFAPAKILTIDGRVAVPESRHGFTRTRCGCDYCSVYCRHVPGRLDVSDPLRLCPDGQDIFAWAEEHLQAVVDRPYPKLVPIKGVNGHCHWYLDGKCAIHANAPYGCAYFDSHMSSVEVDRRSRVTSQAAADDAAVDGLYSRIWQHLRDRGQIRPSGNRAPLEAEIWRIRQSMNGS